MRTTSQTLAAVIPFLILSLPLLSQAATGPFNNGGSPIPFERQVNTVQTPTGNTITTMTYHGGLSLTSGTQTVTGQIGGHETDVSTPGMTGYVNNGQSSGTLTDSATGTSTPFEGNGMTLQNQSVQVVN